MAATVDPRSSNTYCSCQQGRCVLGAYHRCWVRRHIKNNPNQNAAMTRAGTSVVTNAPRDVPPPMPRLSATSELEEEASPRDEPTLGSLLGSWIPSISIGHDYIRHMGVGVKSFIP